jgi:hypothetical protein
VIVGSWPCKVSSEIHINGRHVSELVHEGKGKTMATKPKDEKDSKRACVVLSKGNEVVGLGYSRLTGAAAKVMDRGEIRVTPTGLAGLAETTARIDKQIGLAKTTTIAWIGNQIGLVGLTKTSAQIIEQIGLVGLTGLAGLVAQSRKQEVPVGLLTQKARLWRI